MLVIITMEEGKYYEVNQIRITQVTENEWKETLAKAKKHIKLRLKQKTLSGAHTSGNLGSEPVDYYSKVAIEKILSGDWEWKSQYSLIEQFIRIIDSYISKEVEKFEVKKNKGILIVYKDINENLDKFEDSEMLESSYEDEEEIFKNQIQIIEAAIRGDSQLEILWDCVKEEMKRSEIAEFMELTPRQFDKLREKLINKAKLI